MHIDGETKNQIKEIFQEWSAAKEHRTTVTQQINEQIKVASEILETDKKTARKIFNLMDRQNSSEEYDILQLYEQIKD